MNEIWMNYAWNMHEIWIFILKNLKKKKNRRKIGMTCTRAVWKDFQTLLRTRAGGPTLYEGRARARARARALSTRRFSRVSYIYCQLLELPKNFCGQNNSSSASVREHFRAQLSKFTRVSCNYRITKTKKNEIWMNHGDMNEIWMKCELNMNFYFKNLEKEK